MEKTEKTALAAASALMLIAGILTNLPAVILGRLVDALVGLDEVHFHSAIPFLLLIVLAILAREVLTIVRKYLVENVATQTEKKQTVAAVDHLLKTDLAILASEQIGSLHGRIFRSIQGLVRIIKLGFLDFLPAFFSAAAAIAIALLQKPLLASVMILVIPTGLFIIVKQLSSQRGIRVALLRGKEKIDGKVVETLGGIETVRVANTASVETARVENVAEDLRTKEMRHHVMMAFFDAGKYLNEGFFYMLVISMAIFMSTQGVISKGDILVYSILFLSIVGPLREIHRIVDQAHEGSILVNDLYDLLGRPIDESFKSPLAKKDIGSFDAARHIIDVRKLSFAFAGRPDQALRDINLKIRRGEKIGIAGASGSGKSTLIRILLRLVHGYSGEAYLFGKDLQSMSREEIAEKVSYVPQRTYVFSGTVRENITYGLNGKVMEEAIVAAAKTANIYNEIEDSLGGLDGRVAENGNNLSGGQKQRLAIARLILKSPELFIFDEATSALDNTNESLVQSNIEHMFKDKTMITIAHRLTTLQNADRIFVFEQGRIVQEGGFGELSKKKGQFRDFLTQKTFASQ